MSSTDQRIKVNNNTLTKEEQDDFIRRLLPACQPQEGSPANTFTQSELDDLQRAVGRIEIGSSRSLDQSLSPESSSFIGNNKIDIRDVQQAFNPPNTPCMGKSNIAHEVDDLHSIPACPQEGEDSAAVPSTETTCCNGSLDWHGAPRLHQDFHLSRAFREKVRTGAFVKPTNGVCPGFLQCNLVVLPQGPVAFDFLLFCQRNPKACPLIEVCDVGSPNPNGVAPGADLRTDIPKYVKNFLMTQTSSGLVSELLRSGILVTH